MIRALVTALYGAQARLLGYGKTTRLAEHSKDGHQANVNTALRKLSPSRDGAVQEAGADRPERDVDRSALRLRSDLLEAAHEAIFAWEVEQGITMWNRGAEEQYGWTSDEAEGRDPHELLGTPDEQVAVFMDTLQRVRHWAGELSHATKGGHRIIVEARLAMVVDGGLRYFVEATHDVTEQRSAEAALRASNDRSAFLAEAGRVLGSSLDPQTTLAGVARLAVPHIADWCAVDVMDDRGGLRRLAVAHVDVAKVQLAYELQERYPDDPDAQLGPVHIVRTGEPELMADIPEELIDQAAQSSDHRDLLRSLGLRSYMGVPMTLRDEVLGAITFVAAESGRRFGAEDLSVAEELGRRAAVAVENARLYHQAQESIQARDDFLAAASHDLKNPLGAIRGNAQLLLQSLDRRGEVPPDRLRSALRSVITSSDQMVQQIDEFLDVARLRLGEPLPLDRQPTDLVQLAASAVAAHQASTNKHHLELRSAESALDGEWDAMRLQRVVNNLISNAVKYSPEGGEIVVKLHRESDDAVLIVEDHGIGIPAHDLPMVFERFHRGQNVVGQFTGSGIGLATSKQIVEQHGGAISATSSEGSGSTFTIRLPLHSGD